MPTEVWFRNPHDYIKELIEVGVGEVAWDRGLLVKRKIDPVKHAELYFGNAIQFRILLVGEQGTAEYRNGDKLNKPTAVYPTWQYGEELTLLEEILENPPGESLVACNDKSVGNDERPVWGQEHRVVITDIPSVSTGPGRKLLTVLRTLQEDYPAAIIHIHGLYSFRSAFGMGFGAADIEPRTAAQKGKLHFPSGKEERYERAVANPQWVTSLGFKPVDLAIPRVRCMYNIKSALWAGKNYDLIFNFKTRPTPASQIDTVSPDADYKPVTDTRIMTKNNLIVKPGDKFQCDTCSLTETCKYYRDGAVCSVPGSEPVDLAKMFRTRDSDQIIDGLGILVAANTKRLDRAMREEEAFGDISPEVTRTLGQVFDQGIKLAKLVDPNLRGGTRVQVNVGPGGTASVASANPRQLIATAVRELEQKGVRREDITPDMIGGLLASMADPANAQRAIESAVVAYHDEQR
jgi:hypothetical protein